MSSPEVVTVWRQDDGHWRWTWRSGADRGAPEETLVSNEAYDSLAEATEKARSAFPRLVVDAPDEPPDDDEPPRPRRTAATAVVLALVVVRLVTGQRPGTSARTR